MHVPVRLSHPISSSVKRGTDVQFFRVPSQCQGIPMHPRSVLCNSTLTCWQTNYRSVNVPGEFAPFGIPAPVQTVDQEDEALNLQRDDHQRFYKRTHIRTLLQRTKDVAGETLVIVIPNEVGCESGWVTLPLDWRARWHSKIFGIEQKSRTCNCFALGALAFIKCRTKGDWVLLH